LVVEHAGPRGWPPKDKEVHMPVRILSCFAFLLIAAEKPYAQESVSGFGRITCIAAIDDKSSVGATVILVGNQEGELISYSTKTEEIKRLKMHRLPVSTIHLAGKNVLTLGHDRKLCQISIVDLLRGKEHMLSRGR
jgi:hypothetical protein